MASFNRESSLVLVVITLFINGFSMGLWATPNQLITMNATPKSSYGPVGALINLTRNTGNVTGQAIVTAVMSEMMIWQGFDIELAQVGALPGSQEAFVNGWQVAYAVIISLAGLALFAACRAKPSGQGKTYGTGSNSDI